MTTRKRHDNTQPITFNADAEARKRLARLGTEPAAERERIVFSWPNEVIGAEDETRPHGKAVR